MDWHESTLIFLFITSIKAVQMYFDIFYGAIDKIFDNNELIP